MNEMLDVIYVIDYEGHITVIMYDYEKDEDGVVYGIEEIQYEDFEIGVYKAKYYIDNEGDCVLVDDEPEVLWKL